MLSQRNSTQLIDTNYNVNRSPANTIIHKYLTDKNDRASISIALLCYHNVSIKQCKAALQSEIRGLLSTKGSKNKKYKRALHKKSDRLVKALIANSDHILHVIRNQSDGKPSTKDYIAWSDGSSISINNNYYSGIGGLICNSKGAVVTQISTPIYGKNSFDTEVMAFFEVIKTALMLNIKRLIIYTDFQAIQDMMAKKPIDNRLKASTHLISLLDSFKIGVVSRQYNKDADRLAYHAARQLAEEAPN